MVPAEKVTDDHKVAWLTQQSIDGLAAGAGNPQLCNSFTSAG